MQIRGGLVIEEIIYRLLRLENADVKSNYSFDDEEKALLDDQRAPREEVNLLRCTTACSPTLYALDTPAPQSTV